MSKDDKIPMCCMTPLVRTGIFRNVEWYCRECASTYALTEYPYREQPTAELREELAANEEWFANIAVDCIPAEMRRSDCAACRGGEDHSYHATDGELARSRLAYGVLLKHTRHREAAEEARKMMQPAKPAQPTLFGNPEPGE